MICNRCTTVFYGNSCQCGWKASNSSSNDPMRGWVTFTCAAPNCGATIIRERINANGSSLCRFCRAKGVAVEARMLQPFSALTTDGPVISKDEFGVDLYETIKRFSERKWLGQQYRDTATDLRIPPTERRIRLGDLRHREMKCTKIITDLMPKIDSDDVRRLLGKYEAPVCA